jgi:hypothetical protein
MNLVPRMISWDALHEIRFIDLPLTMEGVLISQILLVQMIILDSDISLQRGGYYLTDK